MSEIPTASRRRPGWPSWRSCAGGCSANGRSEAPGVFVSGYGHFVRTARSLQWDERAVDLDEDRAAWPGLEPGRRDRLSSLLAGFCVGEARVAEELGPFAEATVDPE